MTTSSTCAMHLIPSGSSSSGSIPGSPGTVMPNSAKPTPSGSAAPSGSPSSRKGDRTVAGVGVRCHHRGGLVGSAGGQHPPTTGSPRRTTPADARLRTGHPGWPRKNATLGPVAVDGSRCTTGATAVGHVGGAFTCDIHVATTRLRFPDTPSTARTTPASGGTAVNAPDGQRIPRIPCREDPTRSESRRRDQLTQSSTTARGSSTARDQSILVATPTTRRRTRPGRLGGRRRRRQPPPTRQADFRCRTVPSRNGGVGLAPPAVDPECEQRSPARRGRRDRRAPPDARLGDPSAPLWVHDRTAHDRDDPVGRLRIRGKRRIPEAVVASIPTGMQPSNFFALICPKSCRLYRGTSCCSCHIAG